MIVLFIALGAAFMVWLVAVVLFLVVRVGNLEAKPKMPPTPSAYCPACGGEWEKWRATYLAGGNIQYRACVSCGLAERRELA